MYAETQIMLNKNRANLVRAIFDDIDIIIIARRIEASYNLDIKQKAFAR